ncbi:MAG: DNA-binding protein WhiA [Ruminococcaceae bacterium]|nr:DNA-binding protein WhiA [Oscillospiraceae bacterium]
MSFCSDVKNELISIRPGQCCKPSYIYGFMLFGRSFSIKKISLQTGNQNVAREYADIIKHTYKAQVDITVGGSVRPTYKAEVKSEGDRLKILALIDFGISETVIDRTLFVRECCLPSFIRGAFLACGNINNPEKEYRAEFSVKNEELADDFNSLLLSLGIIMKKTKRGKATILYTKDSGMIEDLLTIMGDTVRTLDMMDTKIMKSVKNNINRARNCDNANISKTVEASIKQRRAIEFFEKTDRLYSLPQELLEVAVLRRDNPEATLKELCKISPTPISLSGMNHRLKRIMEIYEKESH